jgi:hypothetical protein
VGADVRDSAGRTRRDRDPEAGRSRGIVRRGIEPFFDKGLDRRVREAKQQWEAEADRALADQLGPELVARLRQEAEARLAEIEEKVEALNDELWVDTNGIGLPPIPEIPAPMLNGVPSPFAGSRMGFAEFVRQLKGRGEYARSVTR